MRTDILLRTATNFGIFLTLWLALHNLMTWWRGEPLELPALWNEWFVWVGILGGFALRVFYEHEKART